MVALIMVIILKIRIKIIIRKLSAFIVIKRYFLIKSI